MDHVDPRGVGTGHDRVEVVWPVAYPVIHGERVSGPYLFLGVVGEEDRERGYECLRAYGQPIVDSTCPIPVDSDCERQAFLALKDAIRCLRRDFHDTAFDLEKPVFEIGTKLGPCLPDFLIRARRGGDQLTFVVEVMGFERTEYLRGKEVTHRRMETLGTLCKMDAAKFDDPNQATLEAERLDHSIRRVLRSWRQSRCMAD